jgi:hypothetical protein
MVTKERWIKKLIELSNILKPLCPCLPASLRFLLAYFLTTAFGLRVRLTLNLSKLFLPDQQTNESAYTQFTWVFRHPDSNADIKNQQHPNLPSFPNFVHHEIST